MRRLLLATDLDRTLLPNGAEPEAEGARERFTALVARPEVTLAYVSGRDIGRIDEAITTWDLPVPDHAVADVGTSVWHPRWSRDARWDARLRPSWGDDGARRIGEVLQGFVGLTLQDADRQGPFKVSFTRPPEGDVADQVMAHLATLGLPVRTIWSHDPVAEVELLDVLPEPASKRHALEWLHTALGIDEADVVFAGDSGNDLEVMGSELPAVLVGNASTDVRDAAKAAAAARSERLHLATGTYADGILEGVWHFRPDLAP
ncbi:MAG: HAD-IIB family hydrolase [Myxococcota bacterium]